MTVRPRVWRDSIDYRREYFRKNPGIFGFIWFCSQCGKPLLGKSKVHVDHIIPPSKFAKRKVDRKGRLVKNTSMLAEAMNTVLNLVACCEKCNTRKSDKIGIVTVKGYFAKAIELVLFNLQKVIVLLLGILIVILYRAIKYGSSLLVAGGGSAFKALASPIKSNTIPWYFKLGILAVYGIAVFWVFKRIVS